MLQRNLPADAALSETHPTPDHTLLYSMPSYVCNKEVIRTDRNAMPDLTCASRQSRPENLKSSKHALVEPLSAADEASCCHTCKRPGYATKAYEIELQSVRIPHSSAHSDLGLTHALVRNKS